MKNVACFPGITIPLLIILFLLSCSHKKTERELYEETTSGFKFKTYKATSNTAVGPAVKTYNSQQPDTIAPVKVEYAHLLLGYFWAVSSKPAMAFAEADLAEESTDEDVKFMARSLRSITMYEQGWDSLAREESRLANERAQQRNPGSTVQYEATIFYMLLGLSKAYEKDFEKSKFYWAGFATQTGIKWPYMLTDAAADLHGGKMQQGLSKLKAASQDPAVPPSIREALGERIQLIEQKAGNVDSSFFWPRLISAVVLDELKASGNPQLGKLVRMIEGVKEKLPV